MKVRAAAHEQTRQKILAMLSKHFPREQAPIVLEMILMSYHILFSHPTWAYMHKIEESVTEALHQRIVSLVAQAHAARSTVDIMGEYVRIKQEVAMYDALFDAPYTK
jgi:hypothetical protein